MPCALGEEAGERGKKYSHSLLLPSHTHTLAPSHTLPLDKERLRRQKKSSGG